MSNSSANQSGLFHPVLVTIVTALVFAAGTTAFVWCVRIPEMLAFCRAHPADPCDGYYPAVITAPFLGAMVGLVVGACAAMVPWRRLWQKTN